MPMNRDRYPATWPEISKAVKDRAEWRCEDCGIKHGQKRPNRFGQMFEEFMTCAHLGTPFPDGTPGDAHNKMDCRPENLACLCTSCHLLYDLADHIAARRANLRRKKREELLALYGSESPLFDTEERKEELV